MTKQDDTPNTRSVVTFYHEAFDESSSCPIKQEVDLLDYEVLVESYKILAKNHRKHQQKRSNQIKDTRHRRLRNQNQDCENEIPPKVHGNRNDDFVTNKHKQAILTLVEIDRTTKRVIRIRPEFFPSNTRALPACLFRLEALKSLFLDHCKELSCLPAGHWLPQLEELAIDVTGFKQPFPASFGNHSDLKKLVVRGNCTSMEHWSRYKQSMDIGDSRDDEMSDLLLFPPSMAKLTNLKHLETHIRNLLQIPSTVLDAWSLTLETLVTTQDLVASPNHIESNSTSSRSTESQGFLPRIRSFSESTNDSSDDDFDHLLDSSDDDLDTSDDDCGFSLLKHSSLFRKALESQLEVRAFSAIAKFQNLRSLKLLFDDSKHKQDIRNRLRRRKNSTEQTPYCVPLSLLAGPLSMTLRELDIGTCVASSTTSSSRKKSKIPIEIAWIDILQDLPNLQSLRLQDCRASFSSKTQSVDLAGRENALWMPELHHLVLDRCPHFALFSNSMDGSINQDRSSTPTKELSPASSFQDDLEFIDENDIDDDGTEEIVFLPLASDDKDFIAGPETAKQNEYFLPLNDDDVDAMVEEDPEEISRIIRLSGLLADTVLSPTEETKDEDADTAEAEKLSDLCTHFLKRCPNLQIVSLRDCKIPAFCEDLVDCLPKESLCELTLDILECENYESNSHQNHLWDIVKAYPNLEGLHGTCLDGVSDSEFKALHRFLCQRQLKPRRTNIPNSPLQNWRPFWDKEKAPKSDTADGGPQDDENSLSTSSVNHEDATPTNSNSTKKSFHLPAAMEQKLFFLDRILHRKTPGGRILQPVRRSNSRDVL